MKPSSPLFPREAVDNPPYKPGQATVCPRRLLPVLILGCTLAGLSFWGAGVFPGSLFFAAAVLSAAAAGYALIQPRENLFPVRPGVEMVLLLILLGFGLTLLPLPPMLFDLFNGPRSAFWNPVTDLFKTLESTALRSASSPSSWPALSLNRAGTLRGLFLFVACVMAAWLSAAIEPRLKKGFLRFLLIFGIVVAVVGFHSQWTFPQGNRLWWIFPVPPSLPGSVGGFINRNHFAGFVALFCPLAFGLTVSALRDRKYLPALASLVALIVLTMVVLNSLSRGAMLAAGAGIFGVAVLFRRNRIGKPVVILLLGLIGVGIALIVACPPVRTRLAEWRSPTTMPSAQSRLNQWRDGLKMIPDYPLEGVGFNAFGVVYPQYRTTTSSGTLRHAENDYVQFAVETGMAGLLLIALLGWSCYRRRVLLLRTAPADPDLERLVWGAVITVAVHSLFDFPLRIPLYALTVATLAGLLFRPIPLRWPGTIFGRLDPGPSLALLPAVYCLILIGVHPFHRDAQTLDYPHYLQQSSTRDRIRAIAWSPANAQTWFFLGWQIGALDPQKYPAEYRLAERCVTRSAQLDPHNYQIWRHLTAMRQALNDPEGAEEAWGKARALRPWISRPGKGARP
jgi:O-antigen ligase